MKKLVIIVALLAALVAVPAVPRTANAFTMIELIFVIVNLDIITIAIGAPKMHVELTPADAKQYNNGNEVMEVTISSEQLRNLGAAESLVGGKYTQLGLALKPHKTPCGDVGFEAVGFVAGIEDAAKEVY